MFESSSKNNPPIDRFSPQEIMNAGLTIITAHSGCEHTAPNSREHILSAIDSGAEMIEFDIREKDGYFFLSHDIPQLPDKCVPLDEAMSLLQPHEKMKINCDVKTENLMEEVMKTAARYGMSDRIVFTGAPANGKLETARGLGADMWHSLFGRETPEEVEAAIAECRDSGCVSLNLYFKMADEALHRRLLSAGMGLSVWTVNEEADLRRMLELGVMNITTTQPRLALRLRKEIQGTPSHPKKFPVQPICGALQKAGRTLRSASLSQVENGTRQKEGCGNLVTEYDYKIQQYLKQEMKKLFPKACFFAEEADGEPCRTGQLTIYIDPIDGTANFARGCPHFSISLGVVQEGIPIFGAVYLPFSDEMFYAQKGMGAYLNGHPIHVSSRKMSDALVIAGTAPYDKASLGKLSLKIVSTLFSQAADIRRYGSAAMQLCYVACGRAELSFEAKLNPWDYAAGALIAQEAGGLVSNLKGEKLSFDQTDSLLCANREIYADALDICRATGK